MNTIERHDGQEISDTEGNAKGEPTSRETQGSEGAGPGGIDCVTGERGVPSVNRARSLQSRMSSLLALGLMMALGVGLLTWYYSRAFSRPQRALQSAQSLERQRAQGEMALPPLGPISQPLSRPASASAAPTGVTTDPTELQALLGPAPPGPRGAAVPDPRASIGAMSAPRQPTIDRRLTGPVFARAGGDIDAFGGEAGAGGGAELMASSPNAAGMGGPPAQFLGLSPARNGQTQEDPSSGGGRDELASLLSPEVTTPVAARVLPTRRLLLPKGAFIDCTLETAIDSTLPGMTTCITATDTFSADGTVVLLERGTKLVGETRGEVEQGQARIFVLWTEARTSSGVIVPLDSPGTDALGRSGLAGRVERHFWERFGAAILVSVIDGAVQAGVQSTSNGGTVIVSPSGTQEVMTDVLKSTVNIPPTVVVDQGTRIQVLVARDVDFRSVYRLEPVSALSRPARLGAAGRVGLGARADFESVSAGVERPRA